MIKQYKSLFILFIFDLLIFISSLAVAIVAIQRCSKTAIAFGLVYCLLGIFSLYLKDFYTVRKFNFLKDSYSIFEGLFLAAIIPAIAAIIWSKLAFSFLVITFLVSYIAIMLWRVEFYLLIPKFTRPKNVLIIGKDSEKIQSLINSKPEFRLNIVGIKDQGAENLSSIIKEKKVNIVITEEANISVLSNITENIEVYSSIEVYEILTKKVPVEMINEDWFSINFSNIKNPLYNVLKRAFDIGAALVILAVTFPVLVFIAINIKIQDNGPVMYYQTRVGKNGKSFKLYKLRTMFQNAENEGMVDKGNTRDNRIIPFCRWVRKARFDEIPQMINILKGDMSIVGPRAEFIDFVKKYEQEIPFYNKRHVIIPGWTGWAQINQGHCVSIDDITEKLRYDLFYIKNRNIFQDFSILLKAVGLALSGRHK